MRKISIKKWWERSGEKQKVNLKYLITALIVGLTAVPKVLDIQAENCPDVKIIFARGSGQDKDIDKNYLSFKESIETKLKTTSLSYEFSDLDYPAIGVNKIDVLLGAFFGAGEAYEFGESISAGVEKLVRIVNDSSCLNTKYVIGGYSQGAMVISKALSRLNADRMIYASTFGDPKLYLPEGEGAIPPACRGENLSDYRMYVPDCQAYKGLLGAYIPYEPTTLVGKVGTWCNKRDIFCSSHLSMSDHTAYVADNLYEDASRVIFDKITQTFGLLNTVSSPHDTAILIDSTGSMSGLIGQYKNEALRLAEKTLESGGRVALYDYRDYQEGYEARQRCAFETCTIEAFKAGLNEIMTDGGGDTEESLLASSLKVMNELNWKVGSTKSIVVLTDAGYHDPDFDLNGTTRLDVVALSKKIDPVNFYVITTSGNVASYSDLTSETGGKTVTTVDDLSELTDYIIARYDSLPRVEEMLIPRALPKISVDNVAVSGSEATIKFSTDVEKVLVVLDEAILGSVEGDNFTITNLKCERENILTLIPLGNDTRGEALNFNIEAEECKENPDMEKSSLGSGEGFGLGGYSKNSKLPKAPDTGKR